MTKQNRYLKVVIATRLSNEFKFAHIASGIVKWKKFRLVMEESKAIVVHSE